MLHPILTGSPGLRAPKLSSSQNIASAPHSPLTFKVQLMPTGQVHLPVCSIPITVTPPWTQAPGRVASKLGFQSLAQNEITNPNKAWQGSGGWFHPEARSGWQGPAWWFPVHPGRAGRWV